MPFMSWSASNTYSPLETMEPAAGLPVETSFAIPIAGPSSSVSPSSDDVPDYQGERHVSIPNSITSGLLEQTKDIDKDKERATVPSACVQCRSKHLKCDGLNPCTRCSSNSFDCVYVRSRRGFKGPRRNGIQSKAPT